MKTGSRITMLSGALALAVLLWPSGAEGQEIWLIHPDGRVRAEDGGWRAATPADALRMLREDSGLLASWRGSGPSGGASPSRVAKAVLRQVHEPRSPEELDALAGALAEILEATAAEDRYSEMYLAAKEALYAAAKRDPEIPGTPHDGSFDALVRVYETLAARALADGGTDPFKETPPVDRDARNGLGSSNPEYSHLRNALRSIYSVRPQTEGGDYLLALVEAAEPPEPYTRNGASVWCEAVDLLRGPSRVRHLPDGRLEEEPVLNPRWPGRMSELPEIARDPRSVLSRCNRVGNLIRG